MARVEDYRELDVYRTAFALQQRVFEITKTFPRTEAYSLTDQVRRSSRAIGANIAEAWQKRRYPRHFSSKLTDADAEAAETRHWIRTAMACKYVDLDHGRDLEQMTRKIGKMLGAMIRDAARWCN
ncbi:MAG: four helix bundle protein [Bacteroidota bacterium]